MTREQKIEQVSALVQGCLDALPNQNNTEANRKQLTESLLKVLKDFPALTVTCDASNNPDYVKELNYLVVTFIEGRRWYTSNFDVGFIDLPPVDPGDTGANMLQLIRDHITRCCSHFEGAENTKTNRQALKDMLEVSLENVPNLAVVCDETNNPPDAEEIQFDMGGNIRGRGYAWDNYRVSPACAPHIPEMMLKTFTLEDLGLTPQAMARDVDFDALRDQILPMFHGYWPIIFTESIKVQDIAVNARCQAEHRLKLSPISADRKELETEGLKQADPSDLNSRAVQRNIRDAMYMLHNAYPLLHTYVTPRNKTWQNIGVTDLSSMIMLKTIAVQAQSKDVLRVKWAQQAIQHLNSQWTSRVFKMNHFGFGAMIFTETDPTLGSDRGEHLLLIVNPDNIAFKFAPNQALAQAVFDATTPLHITEAQILTSLYGDKMGQR